jgi:hypothetical protein
MILLRLVGSSCTLPEEVADVQQDEVERPGNSKEIGKTRQLWVKIEIIASPWLVSPLISDIWTVTSTILSSDLKENS